MRQSRDAKAETNRVIISEASRLFRERGIASTSVADVMTAAKRTHGGFYRHFENKDALLTAALHDAFEQMVKLVSGEGDLAEIGKPFDSFGDFYLSAEHVANPGLGCPAAALGGEIARGSDALNSAFGSGLRRMIDALSLASPFPGSDPRAEAARQLATWVGAVMLARASDPETASLILESCSKHPDTGE